MVSSGREASRTSCNRAAVYRQPSDAGQKFDYIVCAHKAINPDFAPPLFKDVTVDKTTFVLMQNGVGNEDPFRKVFPACTIISGVVWVGAIRNTPGIISHTTSEHTEMGLFSNPSLDPKLEKTRLDGFAALMRNGGTNFSVEDNIQIKRWEKVVWNACWNPLTTLTDVDTHTWLKSSEESTPMTKRLMTEMIDVARRCDVPIGYDLIDTLFERIMAIPGIYSSMHADEKEGRPLEVDVILGTPMKKAREYGMDVPVLSAMYSLTMAVDQRIRQSKL